MGASKSEVFSDRQNRIARIAKALGHPARVAIIDFLLKQKSCICKDIVDELPLSQPTISQHLRELKGAGLIKGSFEGVTICYCLNRAVLDELFGYCTQTLANLRSGISENCQKK